MSVYSTSMRIQQHRPDPSADLGVPVDVEFQLRNGIPTILEASRSVDAHAPRPMITLRREADAFLTATTPEQRMRCVSQITGALRDSTFMERREMAECRLLLQCLAEHFVFPLLLHCAVRYLHRALATLLRTVYVMDTELELAFRKAFISTLLTRRGLDGQVTLWSDDDHLNHSNSDAQTIMNLKDSVMLWVNCVDSTSVVAGPIFPSVFAETFMDVLPLLGDALRWMVSNAFSGLHNATEGDAESLLGEDLSYVRYGIRVVTTYTHKFLSLLREGLDNGSHSVSVVQRNIARLMAPALEMLSSPIFPKDVLNAAGLLVSSLLTLRSCNAQFLLMICECSRKHLGRREMYNSTTAALDLVRLACASHPHEDVSAATSVVEAALCNFTNNGSFALMKGFLAHLSVPIDKDPTSLGVLLRPVNGLVVIHDVLMPEAVTFCSALHSPDTRFMAIQTIDSVVRHISSVLMCVADLVLPPDGETTEKISKNLFKKGSREALSEEQLRELAALCVPNEKLKRTLRSATEVVMGMWDDGTQQVTGPLYDAYSEILSVYAALRRCAPFAALYPIRTLVESGQPSQLEEIPFPTTTTTTNTAADSASDDDFDTAGMLRRVLLLPDERRGKYHALLGILGVLPLSQFFLEVTAHYNASTETEGLTRFARMLIGGASNHKIGNVVGDVFAKVALGVRQLDSTYPNREELLSEGIVKPLARALAEPGYADAPVQLTESQIVSNIVAHVVMPCLKVDDTYLPRLLAHLSHGLNVKKDDDCDDNDANGEDGIKNKDNEAASARETQSVVEILYRARCVGGDISMYLRRGSRPFRAVLASLQAQESELRITALGLCVLSPRKAEAVEPWQCRMMEWYLSMHLHWGGDSTALRQLLNIHKKWMRRLTDSFANQSARQRRGDADAAAAALLYKERVTQHYVQCIASLAPHIGESVALCRSLAIERRVAALSVFMDVQRAAVMLLPPAELCKHRDALFPASLVPGLLDALSEGWEKARDCAHAVLRLFCRYAPESVFAPQHVGPTTAAAAVDARAVLLRARTFRRAEGAVLRYVLATRACPAAQCAAEKDTVMESHRRTKEAMEEIAQLREVLAEVPHGVVAAYVFVQQRPLHGHISLCAELIADAVDILPPMMKPIERADANARDDLRADGALLHAKACDALLVCCRDVLRICALLVGGEGIDVDPCAPCTQQPSDAAAVDCRGHVFAPGHGEAAARDVVNNAWLAVRTSAAAVRRVLRLLSIESLELSGVRALCESLVDCLLRTKHNGVMRSVREALRAVAVALLRSRDAVFHRLPGEMLDFLLGPGGVASSSVSRMLRRSQGLPHALIAVLEAEDPTIPFFLFHRATRELLRIAAVDTKDEIQRCQRSNALNVLKFLFENKIFATRAVAYLEESFWIATLGFDDDSWGIRNSSLMLFSAVLPRFVGENPARGGVGANTTLSDIAMRAPRAVLFAHSELLRSCESPNPRLGVFPMLQMFSMLTPDPPHTRTKATSAIRMNASTLTDNCHVNAETYAENPADTNVIGSNDSERIIHVVCRCGASRNLMIRAASAVALTSLVPPELLTDALSSITSTLHDPCADLNAMHGALLHAREFHAVYVGTLCRDQRRLRRRPMFSGASTAAAALVSHTVFAALADISAAPWFVARTSHCAAVATELFALAADALHFASDATVEAHGAAVARLGVAIACRALWSPMDSMESNAAAETYVRDTVEVTIMKRIRADRSAVVSAMALFITVIARRLPAAREDLADVWEGLCDVFSGPLGDKVAIGAMDHLCRCIASQSVVMSDAARAVSVMAQRAGCDLSIIAQRSVSLWLRTPRWPCAVVSDVEAALRFLVEFGLAQSSCATVPDELVLQRMAPSSAAAPPLRSASVRHWAMRLVAQRGTAAAANGGSAFRRVLLYYAQSHFDVASRVGVAHALCDALPHVPAAEGQPRAALLLVLLSLLMDDANEVRVAACALASSQLMGRKKSGGLVRDHTTCLLAVVCGLRQCVARGDICVEEVRKHMMRIVRPVHEEEEEGEHVSENKEHEETHNSSNNNNHDHHNNANNNMDEDEDEDEDDDEDDDEAEIPSEEGATGDGGVLFEKEAENMFAEGALLKYLLRVIVGDTNGKKCEDSGDVMNLGVYDELIALSERRGGVALLYETLFDENA